MSYKNRKKKKGIMNQLKYKFGRIQTALLRVYKKVEIKKENEMRLNQTKNIMDWLRKQNKIIRPNNQKIDEWVDNYVNDCIMNGKPVTLLTQWCIAKDLEKRYEIQGNRFQALPAEIELIQKLMENAITAFSSNGITVNWWVTFNNSYLDQVRISEKLAGKYQEIIKNIPASKKFREVITFADWEKDILEGRPRPSQEVLADPYRFIPKGVYDMDFKNLVEIFRNTYGITDDEELRKVITFKIACEAEEGRQLFSPESFFGEKGLLLVPLEFAERYASFSAFVPDFSKRIVSILKPYPWRLN